MERKPYSDSRWFDNPQPRDVQCNLCKHFYGFRKCAAFPNGIPKELLTTEITHNKPFAGDGGIHYQAK